MTEVTHRPWRHRMLAPFVLLANLAHGMLRPVWWTFPLFIGLVSLAFPHLNSKVFLGWTKMPLPYGHSIDLPTGINIDSPYLWGVILLQAVPLAIWLMANIVQVSKKETPTNLLQWDHFISVGVYGMMMVLFGILFAWQSLYWGYVLPSLVVALDAWSTGHFGLNNAAQKPGFGPPQDK